MARYTFGGSASDWTFATYTSGGRHYPVLAPATLTFWDAETGGTQQTVTLNGTDTQTVTVGTDGLVPDFTGPEGMTSLWADAGAGRVRMTTSDPLGALSVVAESGSYLDLADKPVIPSTKADVGLGNVDNTSDAAKPVSDATQTALNAKANASSLAAKADASRVQTLEDLTNTGRLSSATQAATFAGKTQTPQGLSITSYPEHLSRWATKRAAAPYRLANITFIGCSPFYGYYVNGAVTTDEAKFRQQGMVAQVRNLFNKRLGLSVGEGTIVCSDPRVSQTGAQQIGSAGITGQTNYGLRLTNTGQSITLTLTADSTADEIWVHGWNEINSKATIAPQYVLDGGAAVSMSSAINVGTDTDWTYKITGLTAGTHTLVLSVPGATQIDVAGFAIYNSGQAGGVAAGVATHRLAKSGGYIDTSLYYPVSGGSAPSGGGATSNTRSARLTLGRPKTDLLVMGFGINEISTSGVGAGWSPTGQAAKNYQANLTDFVTYATDTYGCDVLLTSLQHWAPASVGTYGEQAYRDIHENLAASNQHVAHLDLGRLRDFKDYNTANGLGYYVDSIHGGLLMHSQTAHAIYEAIGGA